MARHGDQLQTPCFTLYMTPKMPQTELLQLRNARVRLLLRQAECSLRAGTGIWSSPSFLQLHLSLVHAQPFIQQTAIGHLLYQALL
jgi:hypothetical protein